VKITYKLHDSQHQAFSDDSRFIVIAAGRRFGKTVLAIMKAIKVALDIPKANIWFVCPTYRQAEMIAWKMLFEMIPSQLIKSKNEVKLLIELINGSEICLKGADNEDSLRGVSLDYCIMDEVSDMKRNVWQEIIRPMLTDRIGKALFIGTPKGKNHFWELFIKGQRQEGGFSSYQFKTEDNPYISRSEIKEAQEQLSERVFNQEYLASFEDYTGLIWPEFEQKHVIEPFNLPSHWETIGTLDPAITGTTASLQASIDEDGQLFIFSEYYEQNKRADEVASAIKEKAKTWFCDPAGKHKSISRNGVLFSIYDEYSDNGMYMLPAQNDVAGGINRVAEYFKSGKIKIFKNCKNLIHELERYHWSEERETSLGIMEPKPYKSMDHLCDCLRYMVMAREEPSQGIKERVKAFSVEDFERMERQQTQLEEV
jgi:phage terminase large subunit